MNGCINVHLVKYQEDENGSIEPFEYDDSFEYSETTLLSELLCQFAGDGRPICNEHIRLDRSLHYLIRDNHVEWLVPADECTISEYLECFNDTVIELEMPTGIGGVSEVFIWLFKILDVAQKIDWVLEKLKSGKLEKLIETFKSKSGHYIGQTDLKAFVLSKTQWELNDFMDHLKIDDKEIVISILKYYGFESVTPDIYIANDVQRALNQDKFDNYDYEREVMIEKLLKDNHL